jgi:fructokinase
MSDNKKFRVTGLGELLWDLLPEGKKTGGAPANFAFHAQNLGAEASIVSAVGTDILGNELISGFRNLGLDTTNIQVNPIKQTGVVDVKLIGGIPDYEIKQDVAWDYIHWDGSLALLASSADAVCFGSLAQRAETSGQTILKFLKSTRKNCIKVFDINLRQNYFDKKIIEESLGLSTALKLNDEELPVVAAMFSLAGTEKNILMELIKIFGLELIALTKGEKGSFLLTLDGESFLEVPRVNVADTVGAGDAFTAALIVAKLSGKPLKEMHSFASEVAAYVCTQNGATPKLPLYFRESLSKTC